MAQQRLVSGLVGYNTDYGRNIGANDRGGTRAGKTDVNDSFILKHRLLPD